MHHEQQQQAPADGEPSITLQSKAVCSCSISLAYHLFAIRARPRDTHHRVSAALALAVNDLLIGQHRAQLLSLAHSLSEDPPPLPRPHSHQKKHPAQTFTAGSITALQPPPRSHRKPKPDPDSQARPRDTHHRVSAALALAVDHLLIGQHRAQRRAPVDGDLRLVGQPLLEQLQEDPLRPPGEGTEGSTQMSGNRGEASQWGGGRRTWCLEPCCGWVRDAGC
jgi:hypothetical protein